jgi:hypothetical protein
MPFDQLVSLREHLQAYVDSWRSLPAELGALADSCAHGVEDSADRVSRVIDALADPRPSPTGEAA